MPNAPTVDDQTRIVQDIYRLTAERLKARLENPAGLTGAELQAALRFCADYKAAADSAQRAAETSRGQGFDYSKLPFRKDNASPSVRDVSQADNPAVNRARLEAALASTPFVKPPEEQR